MFQEKFREAVKRYLDADSPKGVSIAQGVITRIVNSSTEDDTLKQIQEVLLEFDELPRLLKSRFTPGSLYKIGNVVFGWYREDQVQAEPLPVEVRFSGEPYMRVIGNTDIFAQAERLPLAGGITVHVPHEQTFLYAKHGWANACPIQWYRDEEGYHVDRSIIPHGFWQAWKWWEGAWHWYIKNRPELFENFECWGSAKLGCRHPQAGDVVLGGKNKEYWEESKFYLD